jgi:hypothetical protein
MVPMGGDAMRRWIALLLLLLACWALPARAADPVLTLPAQQSLLLADVRHALVPRAAGMTPERFLGEPAQAGDPGTAPLSADNELWVRVHVRSPLPRSDSWFLQLQVHSVDEAALFQRVGRAWSQSLSGDLVPMRLWPLAARSPTFPLRLEPGETRVLVLRVRNAFPIPAPIEIMTEVEAYAQQDASSVAFGLVLGALALLAASALGQAAIYRDLRYFLFATFSLVLGLSFAALSGIAGQHLWGNLVPWTDTSKSVLPMIAGGVFVWLVSVLCSLRTRSRGLRRLVVALGGLVIAGALACAAWGSVPRWAAAAGFLTAVATALGVAISTFRRGDPIGGWVLAGFLPICGVTLLVTLRSFGLAPFYFYGATWLSVAIGLMLPCLLMALHLRTKEALALQARGRELGATDALTGLLGPGPVREGAARCGVPLRAQRARCGRHVRAGGQSRAHPGTARRLARRPDHDPLCDQGAAPDVHRGLHRPRRRGHHRPHHRVRDRQGRRAAARGAAHRARADGAQGAETRAHPAPARGGQRALGQPHGGGRDERRAPGHAAGHVTAHAPAHPLPRADPARGLLLDALRRSPGCGCAVGPPMRLLIDSFWRAAAYCLHPRVIALSLLPLALMVAVAMLLGYFFWDRAVNAVFLWLESSAMFATVADWLTAAGVRNLKNVIAPLVVVFAVTPLVVFAVLLLVALLMMPAVLGLVARRRFPGLERRQGAGFWLGLAWALGSTAVALLVLVLSVPLWFIPPLILVLPPLIWGWLTYRVMAFDALAGHATAGERREILRRHRLPLVGMGVLAGYLGAAPSVIWVSGWFFLAAFYFLIPVAIWIYTLVFAFASLWFAHYCLSALEDLRAEAALALGDEREPLRP